MSARACCNLVAATVTCDIPVPYTPWAEAGRRSTRGPVSSSTVACSTDLPRRVTTDHLIDRLPGAERLNMHQINRSSTDRSGRHAMGAAGRFCSPLMGLFRRHRLASPAGAPTVATTRTASPGPGRSLPPRVDSDGWAVAVRARGVQRHPPQVRPRARPATTRSTARFCWPGQQVKVVTDGVHSFATSVGAGMYLNQSTGRLYVYADETNGTGQMTPPAWSASTRTARPRRRAGACSVDSPRCPRSVTPRSTSSRAYGPGARR